MASSGMLLLVLLSSGIESTCGDVNVYGKPMTACGPNHGAGCTYAAYDAGAHEVCVTQLPQGFSSQTGQGPWSDEYTGQPWCICIWAYSNYILQNKDLPLKCDSIPSKVLEEQYSLDKFKQCGSMSSTAGCGPEDIRRSIQTLCTQCDGEAPDPAGKAALKAKCDSILASAPAAPMRLYEESSTQTVPAQHQILGGVSSTGLLMGLVALAGLLMSFAIRKFRADNAAIGDHDRLEADTEAFE